MVSPLKHMLIELRPFVAEMVEGATICPRASTNLKSFATWSWFQGYLQSCQSLIHSTSQASSYYIRDFWASFSKLAMVNNAPLALEKPITKNPMAIMWRKLGLNSFVMTRISNKYFKLVEIAMMQTLGTIEDEWTFCNLMFVKNKLRNMLTTNMDMVALYIPRASMAWRTSPTMQPSHTTKEDPKHAHDIQGWQLNLNFFK